jgi:Carboxypeptidase regulatory-like domain
MLKTIFISLLPFLVFFNNGSGNLLTGLNQSAPKRNTGTLEKMVVTNGKVTMELNTNQLGGSIFSTKDSRSGVLRYDIQSDSFFTVTVFNDELRGPLPGAMGLVPQNSKLNASQLVVENTSWGERFGLIVRDTKGFVYFNVEGQEYGYDFSQHLFSVQMGRLLLSKEFAEQLGRPNEAGTPVGQISIVAAVKPIEITQMTDGEIVSDEMPSVADPLSGTVPGPDVIVGDLNGLAQFGNSNGTQVGLAVGTDSCNFGVENLHWFANPQNDHPVIPQNMYRMSGGADNAERFEQIGQSNVKHAFTALTQNICGLGCNGVGGTNLGSGCSDPYDAGLNAGPNLGSRAWINPFNGAYPRNDSATPNNSHTGHAHNGTSHRILTNISDLSTSANPGATYFAEAQYITPHEYAWCQTHPGQCNMYNNTSYRQYNVNGTTSPFSFSPAGATVRTKSAIVAWTGATLTSLEPAPGTDGVGAIAYKVTNPSPGVWHYEYAVYNQNLDRGIQSFSIPIGNGVTISNTGFHAPPQHPGWSGDGTTGNTGYSSTPWAESQMGGAMTWSSETLAQNPNANAIRWGTLYNFRFDSNRPPQAMNATVGFFKTGSPATVQVQGPSPVVNTGPFTVAGRVTTQDGQGIYKAWITLTDSQGVTRGALSSPFGYYSFENVTGGATYTMNALKKGYSFATQMVPVNNNLTDVNFVAEP